MVARSRASEQKLLMPSLLSHTRRRSVLALVFVGLSSALPAASGCDAPLPAEDNAASSTDARAPSSSDAADAVTTTSDAGIEVRTLSLDDAAMRVGRALCSFHARCFETYVRDVSPSVAVCEERYAAAFRAAHLPGARFAARDLTAMQTCEDGLECSALYAGAWQTECPSPRPLHPRADGESCTSDLSCASEACILQVKNGGAIGCGTCAAKVPSAAGEPCGEGARRCGPGHTCLSSKRCVAVRKLGEACDTSNALCGNGLRCAGGTCEPLPAAGEACDARAGCDPYRLAGCGTSGRCESVVYLATGASCDVGSLATCGHGETCALGASDGGPRGTCRARPRIGEACRRSQDCELFATCTEGVCTDPVAPSCTP